MPSEPDKTIPHQSKVEDVIDEELTEQIKSVLAALSTHAAIADVGAASADYVQAEATAVRTALNGVLAVLRDAGLIPT